MRAVELSFQKRNDAPNATAPQMKAYPKYTHTSELRLQNEHMAAYSFMG